MAKRRRQKPLSEEDQRVLDSFKPVEELWWGGRNYGRDMEGEAVPAEGFTFRKDLFRSDYADPHRGYAIVIKAILKLNTKKNRMRLYVQHNGSTSSELTVLELTKCASKSAAKSMADAELRKKDWVRMSMEKYYENRLHLTLEDGTPFCTMFDSDFFYLPVGKYVITWADGHKRRVQRSASGYGTSPFNDP